MPIYASTCTLAALLAVGLLSLAAANDDVASGYLALLRPGTLVQTLDAVHHGRHAAARVCCLR